MTMPRKVNVENMRKVTRAIEREASMFDQRVWGTEGSSNLTFKAGMGQCQTPACIAGHTVAILGNDEDFRSRYSGSMALYAQYLLNLSDTWAAALFSASWPREWITAMANDTLQPEYQNSDQEYVNRDIPTPQQAINVLNHLANQFEADQKRREERWE